jgi:diphosphomevalonate decarboxylase
VTRTYLAKAPSNIALIKYWGKREEARQWPANSSLSMTLNSLCTETRAKALPPGSTHRIQLNGEPLSAQHPKADKIFAHLEFLAAQFPKVSCPLDITSINHFPTGCGIASSASGLAALTLATLGAWLDCHQLDDFTSKGLTREDLAHLARQGSGSAGRSLWGGFVLWEPGESADQQNLMRILPHDHWALRDTVILFSDQPKAVGSTAAHRLAWSSPLFAPRLAIVESRLKHMIAAIENRSLADLGESLETDCLEMHAVMMSSDQPVRYFDHETAEFLAWIRHIRRKEGIPVYFTLDAGPNVHLIYEDHDHQRLATLLETKVPRSRWLCDQIGSGPELSSFTGEGTPS